MDNIIIEQVGFDLDNIRSNSNTCPNIVKLYAYIHRGTFDSNEVYVILKNVTDEEIMINAKAQHPFLHEMCHQIHRSFELVKVIWNSTIFKNYWDNPNYQDKYRFTALQRLSLQVRNLNTEKKLWIKENMKVVEGREVTTGFGYCASSQVFDYLIE